MTSDAAVRREALDPARSFIVQAPAGSGKTELLTQRYLRLLASVQTPEQILAITFTRKAAAEMRRRILEALQAAAGPAPHHEHERTTWTLAQAVRAVDEARGWGLTQHPARLRVMTIDALNAALARRLPVLAGSGASLEPSDDAWPLYELACENLLRRLGDDASVAAPLERLILHLGNRVDRLVELLNVLLAKRDQWLHLIIAARSAHALRERLESNLQQVIARELTHLCTLLGADERRQLLELAQFAAGNLLGSNTSIATSRRSWLESCIACDRPLDADSACFNVWRAIATFVFKADGELYAKLDKRHGFPPAPPEPKARMQAFLRTIQANPPLRDQLARLRTLPDAHYADQQWRILEALLELLPAATAELQLVFQAQGQVDYIEIALRALQALGSADEPTDTALAFDAHLAHILVDEFQDTSFAQLDLLEKLTAGWMPGDGRTLFCVGDPMQSIYRFRQAEVGLFLELQHRGLTNVPMQPLRLDANFRSSAVVVDWVNRVFPSVLAPRDDPEQGAVRYSPSVAVKTQEAGVVQIHPLLNADETAEAERVLSIVHEELETDPGAEIAALVSTRTHVKAIAGLLTAGGVAFQAVEIEPLGTRPVVQDLLALTRALVHLGDRIAWLALLRAPWCGLTLGDLHTIATSEPHTVIYESARAALHAEPIALSTDAVERLSRVLPILDAALAERGRQSLRDWIERTWIALSGPAALTQRRDLDDAQSFLDRLAKLDRAGDLEDVARLESQFEQLYAAPRQRGAARVQVMTMHAAKGLEFDAVILPGLHRTGRGGDRELLRWTRLPGVDSGVVLAPLKAEGADADAIYRWIETLERQRLAQERARLLYVAATRAKRRLHIVACAKLSAGATPEASAPHSGSMLARLWPFVADAFDSQASAESLSTPLQPPPLHLQRLPAGWRPLSPPDGLVAPPALAAVDWPRPEFDWASETARRVGTIVHRELERLLQPNGTIQNGTIQRGRIELELAELGVPADRLAHAVERVVNAIEHTLADSRGRWLLGLAEPLEDAHAELALQGFVGGRLVQGVVDRTFRDARGVRWIIDFKTSTHEGGGLEQFLDEELVRYQPQLERYADLMRGFRPDERVRAALYFPLLRAWREIAVYSLQRAGQ